MAPHTTPLERAETEPWLPPFAAPAARRAWAAAVARYLAAVGAAVGLEPKTQQIRKVLDERGMPSKVWLAHPLLEIEVYLYRRGTRIGIFYQPGFESVMRQGRRDPWDLQYYGVFRNTTTPSMVHRLRWLAGLEE